MSNPFTVGCGCLGASIRFLERLDGTTGKWTRTAICCTCGDARVSRGVVEMTPELRAQLAREIAETQEDAKDEDDDA